MGELLDCWVALFFAGCASEEDEAGEEGCDPPSLKLRGAGPPSLCFGVASEGWGNGFDKGCDEGFDKVPDKG